MNRLIIVPDEAIETLGPVLLSGLIKVAGQVRADNLASLLGGVEVGMLARVVQGGRADELLLWGHSDRGYGVAWTSLAPTEEVVEAASASVKDGLIGEVFSLGRTEARFAGDLQAASWTNLEKRRGRVLGWLAASPVFIMDRCIAVLTLAQYGPPAAQPSLSREDATVLAEHAALLGRLLEDRLLRALLGLKLV